MKKTLFLLAAAATCTACSMDETTEVAGNGLPIDFRTAVATRATPITTNTLTEFNVAAFYSKDGTSFFNETEISITGDGSSKTGESTYYWPSDDSELTFYAYAPTDLNSKGGTISMEEKTNSTIEYTPDEEITNQTDLIAVTATGKRSTNEIAGVQLTFQHASSQIEVQADYADAESGKYTIAVAGVKIGNVYGTATYKFDESAGYGSWDDKKNETTSYEVQYTSDPVTLETAAQSIMGSATSVTTNGTWMLIPQNLTAWDQASSDEGTYLAAYIKITNKADDHEIYPATEDSEYGWAAVGINTNLEPNHRYTYTLKFTDESAGVIPPDPDEPNPDTGKPVLGNPIRFTVTVDDWDTHAENEDVNMKKE